MAMKLAKAENGMDQREAMRGVEASRCLALSSSFDHAREGVERGAVSEELVLVVSV